MKITPTLADRLDRPRPSLFAAMLALWLATPLAVAGQPVGVEYASAEIRPDQLLDVGIELFTPGLPEEDENGLEDRGVFPEVRKSEARFIPFHLKETLVQTGHWGAVRVLPTNSLGADVIVSGEILVSNGRALSLKIRVVDARGRVWRDKKYKRLADARVYDDDAVEQTDPYQSVYNEIANDLVASRDKLKADELAEIREISRLKFAAGLAPDLYGDYLEVGRKGRWQIERLPADGDPMMGRLARIRDRDALFIDTLNDYYADFYLRMGEPYDNWRKFSLEEQNNLLKLRRQARMQKILGSLLLLGAAVTDGGTTVSRAARTAAGVGGGMTLAEGFETSKEAKIHVEALKELAASFDAEIEPLLVEVEGQTLRLEGSAEAQYAEWRRLLVEIFHAETGLPVDPDDGTHVAAAEGGDD